MSATTTYTRAGTEHLVYAAGNGVRVGYILGNEGTGFRIEKIEDAGIDGPGRRLNFYGPPYDGTDDADSQPPRNTILLGTHKWDRPTIDKVIDALPIYEDEIYGAIASPDGRPDGRRNAMDTGYIIWLMARTGMSQRKIAAAIGVTDRVMRYYAAGRDVPYAVQFALEVLARRC